MLSAFLLMGGECLVLQNPEHRLHTGVREALGQRIANLSHRGGTALPEHPHDVTALIRLICAAAFPEYLWPPP
jgi:predicted ATPase